MAKIKTKPIYGHFVSTVICIYGHLYLNACSHGLRKIQ